jgi:hypothetical protein
MAADHTCGHLHQWFARCFQAKHDQTGACSMQMIPTWHYPEAFPCPPCYAQRKIDLAEFLANKGRQPDSGSKTVKFQQEFPQAPLPQVTLPRLRPKQAAALPYNSHQISAQPSWNREAQLQTMADGALNLPLIAPSAHTPWVPPSRRSTSIIPTRFSLRHWRIRRCQSPTCRWHDFCGKPRTEERKDSLAIVGFVEAGCWKPGSSSRGSSAYHEQLTERIFEAAGNNEEREATTQ